MSLTEKQAILQEVREEVQLLRPECRNCHDTESDEEMIAPCMCSGSIKYVHRSCLNQWRAVSHNSESFYNCDVCKFEYVIKTKLVNEHAARCKFTLLVMRDFIGILAAVQLVIFLFAGIVFLCDWDRERDQIFPHGWSKVSIDYVCGICTMFFLLGLYGCFLALKWCCCESKESSASQYHHTYSTYPYGWGYYYIWFWPSPGGYNGCTCDCGNCNTSGSSCGGGNCDTKGDSSILVVLGIIVLVIIAIGAVVGIVLMTVVVSRIIQRHIHVLRMLRIAESSEVVDLEKEPLVATTTTSMV